jgi:endonuclease YncB( thermonuclease family)
MDSHCCSTTIKRILPIILVLVLFSNGWADYTGQVVRILDGDTIEVLHNHHAERIRLSGIDCPEKGQAYGKRAKQEVLGMEGDARGSRCGGASSPPWSWRRTIISVP